MERHSSTTTTAKVLCQKCCEKIYVTLVHSFPKNEKLVCNKIIYLHGSSSSSSQAKDGTTQLRMFWLYFSFQHLQEIKMQVILCKTLETTNVVVIVVVVVGCLRLCSTSKLIIHVIAASLFNLSCSTFVFTLPSPPPLTVLLTTLTSGPAFCLLLDLFLLLLSLLFKIAISSGDYNTRAKA